MLNLVHDVEGESICICCVPGDCCMTLSQGSNERWWPWLSTLLLYMTRSCKGSWLSTSMRCQPTVGYGSCLSILINDHGYRYYVLVYHSTIYLWCSFCTLVKSPTLSTLPSGSTTRPSWPNTDESLPSTPASQAEVQKAQKVHHFCATPGEHRHVDNQQLDDCCDCHITGTLLENLLCTQKPRELLCRSQYRGSTRQKSANHTKALNATCAP